MPKTVNWAMEIQALGDMCVMACRGHEVVADALVNELERVAKDSNAVFKQKILMARIAAESVSAHKDLGALAVAIGGRRQGILRGYFNYGDGDVHRFYQGVLDGTDPWDLAALPTHVQLKPLLLRTDAALFRKSRAELTKAIKVAAHNYKGIPVDVVQTYNRIKHGFAVISNMGALRDSTTLGPGWEEAANVLTGIKASGEIKYTQIERSAEHILSLLKGIKMCKDAWNELAATVIALYNRGVPPLLGLPEPG